MNKENFNQLILVFTIDASLRRLDLPLDNITVKLENANESSIVFYNLHDTQSANEQLVERLKGKKIGVLVINSKPKIHLDVDYIVVNEHSFLEVQKMACDKIYPSREDLKLAGITGTNGKTTVASLAAQLSSFLGFKSYTVGTLGVCNEKGEILINTGLTTPSYIEIRKIIAEVPKDLKAIFFEVSSHALIQERFYELNFDAGAWTSFSQDHLDYHNSMESYFEAKSILPLKKLKAGSDFHIPSQELSLIDMLEQNNIPFKKGKSLAERKIIPKGEFFRVHFNKSNLEVSLSLCESLWGKIPSQELIGELVPPKGRFSPIEFSQRLVIIDYAHTPDALSNVCRAVKATYPGQSVKIVFGCGGNRDKKKRPLMAEAIGPYVSLAYITSDNPRNEEPEEIIKDILPGLTTNYVSDVDRKRMIERAINELKASEILIIAGKGHEDYQEIKGVKSYFSDFDIVNETITRLNL